MIARAMQRISTGTQSYDQGQPIKFDKLVQSWPLSGSSPPPFTYFDGTFSIPNATSSDYLITWTIAIKTATVLDGIEHAYLLRSKYGNGELTESCFSSLDTTTGLVKGFKILHIIRISDTTNDRLSFVLVNNCFYTRTYLDTPSAPLPTGITPNEIGNISLSIISL